MTAENRQEAGAATPGHAADSFDSPDGRTYSLPVTAKTPGQAERCALEDAIRERVSADCMDEPCQFCDRAVEALMPLADAYAKAAVAAPQPQGGSLSPADRSALVHYPGEHRAGSTACGQGLTGPEPDRRISPDRAEVTCRRCKNSMTYRREAKPDEPQPAPELTAQAMRETASRELAAAMAEARRFREALQIARSFLLEAPPSKPVLRARAAVTAALEGK